MVKVTSADRVLIMGAAGRDFHNFNVYFRDNPAYEVVAFTATQIPDIAGRCYPPQLAGALYPNGIPIEPEEHLTELIVSHHVNQVVFSYSDVSHEYVMHTASAVLAAGADFRLLGPDATMLHATVPVVAVTAVRTGSGKSQTTRRVAHILTAMGKRVVIVRHPMPYGDLTRQICQRFAIVRRPRPARLHHRGARGVRAAPRQRQHRLRRRRLRPDSAAGAGRGRHHPLGWRQQRPALLCARTCTSSWSIRCAPATKYHTTLGRPTCAAPMSWSSTRLTPPLLRASPTVRRNVEEANPQATVIDAASPLFVEGREQIRGKRVLVVEDGPTLTHGGMSYGAGVVAARKFGAAAIVDPRPYAVGSIADTFRKYPTTGSVLPAMGYGAKQVAELEATLRAADCDLIIIATPIDLRRVIGLDKPSVRVRYELQEIGKPDLTDVFRERFG